MGLFSFKKKSTNKVETAVSNDSKSEKVDDVKHQSNISFEKLHEHASVPENPQFDTKIQLQSIDCRFDKKNKSFIYNTGLSLNIPTGYIGVLSLLDDEGNALITNDLVNAENKEEILIEFKSANGRYIAQPYPVGCIVANITIEKATI